MRRILSIDGGGIRGTFPAAFLAALEEDLEHPIGSYFDLIAGTSTGGIIAIALAMGIPAREVAELYEKHGPEIFAQNKKGLSAWLSKWHRTTKWAVWGPKYETSSLRQALEGVLGNRRIGEAKTRLMVPSWNGRAKKVYVYKTAHNSRLTTDYKDPAIDAALATSAAPTYFREYITANDVGLVDGGLWANNPTGFAVIEATSVLGWPSDQLRVLSVSCLEDIFEMKQAYSARSIVEKTADFFMAGQSHGSMGIAHLITGDPHERKAIWRICQPVPDGFFSIDNTKKIQELKARGFTEARIQKPILKPHFFTEPAAPFVPFHKLEG
ncbi:MAG: CBASS cGAMP-activated phospholipase [Pseudomonadota bacterium]